MNTKDLQTIKNADFTDDTHADKICNEMRDIVGRKTDDFTKPDNLSDTKIDMTDTIKPNTYCRWQKTKAAHPLHRQHPNQAKMQTKQNV